jgi:integrase
MPRKIQVPGIRQLGPGLFELRTQTRYPGSDKRRAIRRIVEAATVRDAIDSLEKLREELLQQGVSETPAQPTRQTLTDYARSWLEQKKLQGMKPSTLARYLDALEHAILPALGSKYVDEIDRLDIKSWLSWAARSHDKRGRTRSPATANAWLRILKSLVRDAVADFELERDPTMRVKALASQPQRVTDEEPNSLTADELRRFLEAAAKERPEVYAICILGFFTGMRFGEIAALQWNDIREDEGLVLVRRSVWRNHVTTTKTGTKRSAALHPIILEVIKAHRTSLVARKLPVMGTAWVFPSGTGRCHRASYLKRPFERVLKAAKIEKHFSPHGMRRTFNNLMRQAQVDRTLLHSMIGHSSDKMTELYSHVDRDEKLAAVDRLAKIVAINPQKAKT